MINLSLIIGRINALLQDDTNASVTYAALEARLALEKVCYDRLRQRHDYISHDQLRKWQPGAVINVLMKDVDPDVARTLTLSIGKSPADTIRPEDDEYVEIGTQIGFDLKKITKLWQALAKLALHAHLPEHSSDNIPDYGDQAQIRAKVVETLAELESLAKGTMTFSGIGNEVSFVCSCGEKNKRRAALLGDGQHIYCINPDCKYTWKVIKEGEEIGFHSVKISIDCDECSATAHIPPRYFFDMKHDEIGAFICKECGHKNYVQWKLMQARKTLGQLQSEDGF